MRFMLMLEAGATAASDHAFDATAVAALERYGALLLGAGVLLEAARLHPPGHAPTVWLDRSRGARVDAHPEQGGIAVQWFWLIEVRSLEEAIEWARRCTSPSTDAQPRIVIRALVEGGDAPPART
jgi:hypothetical protein